MARKIKIDDNTYECQPVIIVGQKQWAWLTCLLTKTNIVHAVQTAVNLSKTVMIMNNKANAIDRLVEKDHYTNDIRYNSGLKLLKENSYLFVCGNPDVEYYCMCNGYD